MATQKLSKEIIIETAFNAWGEKGYKDMSLTLISNKLKISKAALYRYFKNKDDLLDKMGIYINKKIHIENLNFVEQIKKLENTKNFNPINLYVDIFINFYSKNPCRLFFYTILLTKTNIFSDKKMKELRDEQISIFSNYLSKEYPNRKDILALHLLFYITTTIIFYLTFQFILKVKISNSYTIEISGNEKKHFATDINNIILNGFYSGDSSEIDFIETESLSLLDFAKIPNRPRILEAIASLVAEEGIWNVSIDKIAKKSCMAKSSLYFYFNDKNQMIAKMIENEIQSVNNLFLEMLNKHKDFKHTLYAHIFGTYNHFLYDLEHLKIINWLHFQDIELNNKEELFNERFGFFNKEYNKGSIRKYNEFNMFPIIFVNVQISKDIMLNKGLNIPINQFSKRFIYNMFLYGLKGGFDEN